MIVCSELVLIVTTSQHWIASFEGAMDKISPLSVMGTSLELSQEEVVVGGEWEK